MQDPALAMKAVADWQTRSMERLAEDARDCAEFMTRAASGLVGTETEAGKQAKDAATA